MTIPDFIDTHHHLWDLKTNSYPWLNEGIDHFVGDYEKIRKNYLISDFFNSVGDLPIRKSVHVQAEWDPSLDPSDETKWLQSVADDEESRGMPNAIIGFANFQEANIDETLYRHSCFPNWRGIRQMLNWDEQRPNFRFAESGDLMVDERWRKGYKLLEKYNASFDLQVWPWQLIDCLDLATKFPNIFIILNHTGMPIDFSPDGINLWKKGLKILAKADNVAVKISALGMMNKNWTKASIDPLVTETIEIFGAKRCMFASNFPVDSLFSDYKTLWQSFDEITKDFTKTERSQMFMLNAERIYNI
jgi:predicted TIM-barrel fold metal-dependent hydrolase